MNRILLLVLLTHCVTGLTWAKSEKRNSLTLSANIPHVLNLNYDVRVKPWLSLGVAGGYFGLTVQSSETGPISISTQNYEGHLRLHPFSGAFFIGFLMGSQKVFGETARSIAIPQLSTSVSLTGSATITSMYLTPHLGWFWRWDSGFTLGFDVGWQISFSPNTTITVPIPSEVSDYVTALTEYQDLMTDLQDVGNKLGSLGLPMITLLRFGWSF